MSAFTSGHNMRLAWATLLLTVPSVALANSGIGFLMLAVSVMLVPMFFITWWVEQRVIVKRLAELPASRVRRSTFAANLMSYVAMIACVLAFAPEHGRSPSRAYTSEAMLAASPLRLSVQEFWEKYKRYHAHHG